MSRPSMAGLQREVDEVKGVVQTHEAVCAERYKRIDETLDTLMRRHSRLETAACGILIAILGWMAVQVWDGRNNPTPATAVSVAR